MLTDSAEIQAAVDAYYDGALELQGLSDITRHLVPAAPLAKQRADESPFAQLVRVLHQANGGMVDSRIRQPGRRDASSWLDTLIASWVRLAASGEPWIRGRAQRELHRFDPHGVGDALATIYTAVQLDYLNTVRLLAAADPERLPASAGGVSLQNADRAADELAHVQTHSDSVSVEIDGMLLISQHHIMTECARALRFSGPEPQTWYEFGDILIDLGQWLPAAGYFVMVQNGRAFWTMPDDEAWTFVRTWLDAASYWARRRATALRLVLVW